MVADCDGFQLGLTALADRVLRLHYWAAAEAPTSVSWAVTELPPPEPTVQAGTTEDGRLELCTESWVAHVQPDSCKLRVAEASGTVLLEDGSDGGWQQSTDAVRVTRLTPAAEPFYGCGEKTGELSHRGRHLVFWNTDAYDPDHGGFAPDQDPLYLSIPFFIGLREGAAYGLFTDNSHRIEMDLAAADPSQYEIEASGGQIDQYLLFGPEMSEVVRRYTALTGRPPLPPRWSLGYHQSRWGYWPDARLEEVGQEFRDRAIPADGLWLDIQHMDGFRTFTWDPNGFADPIGLAAALEANHFKLTVIADPGIKVDPGWQVYDSGLDEDAFLRWPNGDLYVGNSWAGECAFPDFTEPVARSWWGDQVGELLETGVRGIWLDLNEPTTMPESGEANTIDDEVLAHGHGQGTTMAEVHNVYALSEAQATYEAMLASAPDRRPFILSRAGYAGIQRYAAIWTGDAPSTWQSLEQVLPMLLNLGVSGVAFTGSDVGGYSGSPGAELFARWLELGAVSPFFRNHVTTSTPDQEPWAFGGEVEDISRHWIGLRYRLLPYLYSLFAETTATGAPVLRPLVYHFQDDAAVRELADQAMVGPYLLVAPVIEQGAAARSIYLPAGRWYEYHSGAIYDGPTTIERELTLADLPLFVREGAILPHGPLVQWTDQAPTDPLVLHVYPASEESTFVLYEDDGDGLQHHSESCFSRTPYALQQTATGTRLSIGAREGDCPPPARTLEVRLRRADLGASAVSLSGSPLTEQDSYDALVAAGSGWWADERDLAIVVRIPDQADCELDFAYDPTISELRPDVEVAVRVDVPTGTPLEPPIHISTSASGWTQQPLTWDDPPESASGLVSVPRGAWFYYKYTRGSWGTVEKWPGCEEADNRYGFGAAHPERHDEVFTWADWCGL